MQRASPEERTSVRLERKTLLSHPEREAAGQSAWRSPSSKVPKEKSQYLQPFRVAALYLPASKSLNSAFVVGSTAHTSSSHPTCSSFLSLSFSLLVSLSLLSLSPELSPFLTLLLPDLAPREAKAASALTS